MDARIAQLNAWYRFHGPRAGAALAASRLDLILATAVTKSYEQALDEKLINDPAVYVLRRVMARTTLIMGDRSVDSRLAKNWGIHLAWAVFREIAAGAHDGNLVRFENQADYVSQYLVSRLRGNDRHEWFFDAFSEFGALDSANAINRCLLSYCDLLPAILSYVQQADEIESLMAALEPETRRALWSNDLAPLHDVEARRSLFSIAVQLANSLEVGGAVDSEDLFRDYLGLDPPLTDWGDPKSLAASVLDVLRFLFARGYLARSVAQDAHFPARLSHALSDFDWLDREWLTEKLLAFIERDENDRSDLPVRALNRRATPRQMELLTVLARLLNHPSVQGNWDDDPIKDALKVFALLAGEAPDLVDAAAKMMIENLLVVRSALQKLEARAEFLRRMEVGDAQGASSLLTERHRAPVANACQFLARLGGDAARVLETISADTVEATLAAESECAGVALILRTMMDCRLHLPLVGSSEHVNWPSPAMLFLSIALRLGGMQIVSGDRLDEGLCMLAGLKKPITIDEVAAAWINSGDQVRLQTAMLSIAAGRRFLNADVMHVFLIAPEGGGGAVVAADASASLFLLGSIIESEAHAAEIIPKWLDAWVDATGKRPEIIVSDENLRMLLQRNDQVRFARRTDEIQKTHDVGQTNLGMVFEVLKSGNLGKPDLDLTLTIAAGSLLRMWSHWLRGFSSSSLPFILEKFLQRPGRVQTTADGLVVTMARCSLDVVLEMAGYLETLTRVPWLSGGRVKFQLQGD